jgi:hypothetical protein
LRSFTSYPIQARKNGRLPPKKSRYKKAAPVRSGQIVAVRSDNVRTDVISNVMLRFTAFVMIFGSISIVEIAPVEKED